MQMCPRALRSGSKYAPRARYPPSLLPLVIGSPRKVPAFARSRWTRNGVETARDSADLRAKNWLGGV